MPKGGQNKWECGLYVFSNMLLSASLPWFVTQYLFDSGSFYRAVSLAAIASTCVTVAYIVAVRIDLGWPQAIANM